MHDAIHITESKGRGSKERGSFIDREPKDLAYLNEPMMTSYLLCERQLYGGSNDTKERRHF